MNRLQRKAIMIEFKSDVKEFGFLAALNRLSFELGCIKTEPLSPERDIVYARYRLHESKIRKLNRN